LTGGPFGTKGCSEKKDSGGSHSDGVQFPASQTVASSGKLVPDAVDRLEIGGIVGVRLDLPAKRGHMPAQAPGIRLPLQCPDVTMQLLSRDGPPPTAQKTLQDAELRLREAKRLPILGNRSFLTINGDCPE